MRRLLTSALLVVGAAGAVALGTRSFFSDTESSTGNVFAAGDIDLQIGNQSYYNGVASAGTSWTLNDLTIEKFFDFLDVKPGDYGEGTVQVRVGSNPAYVCANVQITQNNENSLTEPELDLVDTAPVGELAQALNFAMWRDDGDNVYESDEVEIISGPASDVLGGGTLTLADSDTNNVGGIAPAGVPANGDFYIGQAWCFGTLTTAALPQSAYTNPVTATNFDDGVTDIVSSRDGGFICDGVSSTNITQTDSLVGNVNFYAVQTRNNPTFQCTDALFPTPSGSPSPSPSASPTDTIVEVNSVGATPNPTNWVFWNDETDVSDNTLGSFVAGPSTPPVGTGSVQMSVTGTQRRNLATYQFAGTQLSDITTIKFNTFQSSTNPGSPNNRAIYLNFNVDFVGSNVWQRRLVYVPSANGSVSQDVWQEWDAINSGNALWTWSGYANGPDGNAGTVADNNTWPDANTNANRTWNDIMTAFPSASVLSPDSHWGFRAGEPYADGFTGNIDKFTLGVLGNNTIFDFDN